MLNDELKNCEFEQKVKKLKLKPFEEVTIVRVAVTIHKFTLPEVDEDSGTNIGYGAAIVMWMSTENTQDHPVTTRLPFAGPCYINVAIDALAVATNMCEEVGAEIPVFDGKTELFALSAEDLLDDNV